MHQLTPQSVISIASHCSPEESEAFRLRRMALQFDLENRDVQPTEDDYDQAAEHMTEISGIMFDAEEAKALLSLYPVVRISVATGDLDDNDVRWRLNDMIADAFVNSRWPSYDDEIDIQAFVAVVRTQANAMGYSLVSPSPKPTALFRFA